MSRVEKNIENKIKKSKFNRKLKLFFLLILIGSSLSCIFIVDNNIKYMLGKETFNTSYITKDAGSNINKFVKSTNESVKELFNQVMKKISK